MQNNYHVWNIADDVQANKIYVKYAAHSCMFAILLGISQAKQIMIMLYNLNWWYKRKAIILKH